MPEPRPPVPPFTAKSARRKIQDLERVWNSCDPETVALACTRDSVWRHGDVQVTGRPAIIAHLTTVWLEEPGYSIRMSLWGHRWNRIASRFQYEWHDADGRWWRTYGNELYEFRLDGLISQYEASINDRPIQESERRIFGPRRKAEQGLDFPMW